MTLCKRGKDPAVDPNEKWHDEYAHLIVPYGALNDRVGDRDALMWQSPAMALTAQAFLITIALGHDTAPVARFLAAVLGIVVTIMSIQLMLKHRLFLATDEILMISLERRMGVDASAVDHSAKVQSISTHSADLSGRLPARAGVLRWKSVTVWVIGLSFFGVINVLLMVFALFDALGFPCLWMVNAASGARCVIGL
jgi:hypothetical protein